MANLIVGLGSPDEGKIVIQTRKGNDIQNNQLFAITRWDCQMARELKRKYPLATFRTSLCGIYNCHGLTFASRRARIYRSSEIVRILEEDDYQEIQTKDLKPGDVVVYYKKGDAQHSGIVLRVDHIGSISIPIVLSKWGSGQEAIHSLYDCPYSEGANFKYYKIRGSGNEN